MSMIGRAFISNAAKKPKTMSVTSGLQPRNLQTEPKNKITSYIFNKYVAFVKSYEKILKKNFPAAVKFYQVFSVGVKYFKEDTMQLFKAFKKVNSDGLHSLTRKELEVYHRMPKDMIKAAPVLVIGAGIPLGGFIFVIAQFFPRLMLTHHFWSLQQRSQFCLKDHKKKLKFHKPVFSYMQKQLAKVDAHDNCLFNSFSDILKKLASGMHPSADLILSCKPLFEKPPYSLESLSRAHIVSLLKLHGMHRGWRRKQRLHDRANMVQLLDTAIAREGGLEILTQDEIKWHCFLRGLNPISMGSDDICKWLQTWMTISGEVDEHSYSLLLHCPILLGYNQPSNWWLLHDKNS